MIANPKRVSFKKGRMLVVTVSYCARGCFSFFALGG
jgi:hypothetical protein